MGTDQNKAVYRRFIQEAFNVSLPGSGDRPRVDFAVKPYQDGRLESAGVPRPELQWYEASLLMVLRKAAAMYVQRSGS